MAARARIAVAATALAAALACASTTTIEETARASFRRGSLEDGTAVASPVGARARGPRDTYLAIKGKGKAPGEGVAFFQGTLDLWAPFDVWIRYGFFNPKRGPLGTGTRGCLEVSGEGATTGFSPSFDMCADARTGGLDLVSLANGAQLPTTSSIDHLAVELRVEADGSMMNYYWRLVGDASWTLLNQVSFDAASQTTPLKPSFGALGVMKKTEVGFDLFHVDANSPSPFPLTPEQEAVVDIHTALLAQLEADYALDGAFPDTASAQAGLAAARAALADAAAKVAALTRSKATAKAARNLAKGDRKTEKALAKLAAGKAASAQKQIEKAGKKEILAILLLVPQSIE